MNEQAIIASSKVPRHSVVLSVDYDGFKPESYRGVIASGHDASGGDFSRRFYTASQIGRFLAEFGGTILYSSSVDDFKSDGGRIPSGLN